MLTVELSKEDNLEIYRRMKTIRRFEEVMEQVFRRGEFYGAAHSSIGQEATQVGAIYPLHHEDLQLGSHRSHGYPIAKGVNLKGLMAELYGKETGVCRGKSASMHLAEFSSGVIGASGILASQVPVAVGEALAAKKKGTNQVVMVFFGDGAASQGVLYESMNLASIYRLPLLFLCENNLYAHYTKSAEIRSNPRISDRAPAFGMPGVTVDGQDVHAVYKVAEEAVQKARSGEGPTFVEAMTYLLREHAYSALGGAMLDERRPKDELERERKREPVGAFRKLLTDEKVASAPELEQLDTKVEKDIQEALKFARESPYPDMREIFEDTYADPTPLKYYLSKHGREWGLA